MQGEEILALSTAPELTAPVMGVTISAILDSVFYALVLWGPPNKCPTSQPPLHWCLWPGPKWPGCLTHPSPHLFPSKSWPVVSVVIPCFQAGAVFCLGHLSLVESMPRSPNAMPGPATSRFFFVYTIFLKWHFKVYLPRYTFNGL